MFVFADKNPSLKVLLDGLEGSLKLQLSIVAKLKETVDVTEESVARQHVYPLLELLEGLRIHWEHLRAVRDAVKEQTCASREEEDARFMEFIKSQPSPFRR